MIVLDVDGTMTDGGIAYTASGEEIKTFNVKDGFAITNWRRLGKKAVIITGRNSPIVQHRATELGIDRYVQGIKKKGEALRGLCEELGVSLANVAVIGDDLNDLSMFHIAGRSFAPSDASPWVLKYVDHVLQRAGGGGAVAEMVEMLVEEMGIKEAYLEPWV